MINRVDRLINQREDKVKIDEVDLENDKIIQLYKGKKTNLFYIRLPIEKEVIRQVSVNLFMKFLAKKISFQEMMSIAEGTTVEDMAEFSGVNKISHVYVNGDVIVNGDELVKFSFEAPSYENIDSYKSNIKKIDLGALKKESKLCYKIEDNESLHMISSFGTFNLVNANTYEIIILKENESQVHSLIQHYITELFYVLNEELSNKAQMALELSKKRNYI